ncbi:MAG: 50S ribosomal protein L10 [Elusimicrobia bacterium RIFOXYA2_FULL_39_19]|nr:MAG: 50S ribosomal protein L10 [Elusimicrobia bacterium RIFOXYA2_FULL_39_19]
MVSSKEKVFESLTKDVAESQHLIFTEYQGLKVNEIEELRKCLKSLNSRYYIPKNKILSIVFKNKELNSLSEGLKGPIGLVFVKNQDPVQSLKKVIQFAKDHNNLKLKSGFICGRYLTIKELSAVANLPSKEVLIAQTVFGIKMNLVNLVNVLKNNHVKLVCTIEQIKKVKEKN